MARFDDTRLGAVIMDANRMDSVALERPTTDRPQVTPLRICHLGPYPARGGGVASVTRMLVGQQQHDPDLSVEAIATSVDGGKIGKLIALLKSIAIVRTRCQHFDNLILHVHASHGRSFERKAWLMNIAERYRVPVLLHIHGSEFDRWYERQSEARKRAIQYRLNRVTRIVVVSNSWNEYVSRLTTTQVTTVHNAVDASYFGFSRNYAAPPTFVVLFLGGVGLRRKGAFDLLDAIERISATSPTLPLRVIMAGHGEIDEARTWIAAHGLSEKVNVPGWIDLHEKDRLLRESHVFVLPSYHEGLPIALLEAMASGLPVVVTPVGGIPDAVQDDYNGLLVPAGDVPRLCEALQRVLLHASLRERIGSQARQTVRDSFDLRVAASKFKAIYMGLRAAASHRRSDA